ncbi:hypothetical protein V3C99_008587 [Haemonchus contortus]
MSSGVDGRASPLTVTKVTESNTGIINSISNISSLAGFDYSENDQDKRRERMQEQINNCVTSKQIRVLMMPNVTRAPLKEIARKFIKEVVRTKTHTYPHNCIVMCIYSPEQKSDNPSECVLGKIMRTRFIN